MSGLKAITCLKSVGVWGVVGSLAVLLTADAATAQGFVNIGIGTGGGGVAIGVGGGNPIRYIQACNQLLQLLEGPFGALLTVGAGIGAIVSSAVGGFRTAWTLVVVAVGAFILRSYVTLFFQGC
jgi:hypothetical protein